MSESPGKQVLKRTVLIFPWLMSFLLVTGWGLAVWTPGYLEQLVPRLAADMGLELKEFHVRRAGLLSADIGPVLLGSKENGFELANVHIEYTPASLKMERVQTVVVTGLSLHGSYENGLFDIPALAMFSASGKTGDSSIPVLPMDSLLIRNSSLILAVKGKSLTLPFSAEITQDEYIRFIGTIAPRDQTITLSGSMGPTTHDLAVDISGTDVALGAMGDLLPVPITGSVDFAAKASINTTDMNSLNAEASITVGNATLPETEISLASNATIAAGITIKGNEAVFSVKPLSLEPPYPMTVAIPSGRVSPNSVSINLDVTGMGVRLPGQLTAFPRKDGAWDISLKTANWARLKVRSGGQDVVLSGIELNVTGTVSTEKSELLLTGHSKGISLPAIPIRSGAMRFSLPLAYPAPTRHTPGKLRIKGLYYDKYRLGTVVAQIQQQGMGLGLDGALYSQLLPDLKMIFQGRAAMEPNDISATFAIPRYTLPTDYDPSALFPALAKMKLNGKFSLVGGLAVHNGEIESNMRVALAEASLVMGKEGSTRVEGVQLIFESPDLLHFRSAPAQQLSFDSLNAGPVSMNKGRVTFQVEPQGVILVEHADVDWVGGHMSSRAFRIVPGHEEYNITLFCSRLRLSDLLMQLGLAEAKGEAALSGELPVSWKRGKISFNNGFLHSTPGEDGVIQVQALEDMINATPKGSPQRGQLELAQAAIKEFEYKWVRVKADTVGKELLVRLSLDGKPARILPFVYKKELGGFGRVASDVQGSNFQGLRLDVNFSLPLDRILLYKDVINMIE